LPVFKIKIDQESKRLFACATGFAEAFEHLGVPFFQQNLNTHTTSSDDALTRLPGRFDTQTSAVLGIGVAHRCGVASGCAAGAVSAEGSVGRASIGTVLFGNIVSGMATVIVDLLSFHVFMGFSVCFRMIRF
jgi:hypothetical protein